MTLAEMPVPADPESRSPSDLQRLTEAILAFRDERDWKQFHSLRHLIVSLNLEAAELLDEGIAVLPLPIPEAAKETLQ